MAAPWSTHPGRTRSAVLRTSICAIVLTMAAWHAAAAPTELRFRRLSIEDGLSQSTVEAIAQDDRGFMWFGTEDGLNRYDGYGFTRFKHDPDLPGSLSGNNIWCLRVDRTGVLWVGTFSSGLNRYDPATGTFTRFVHDPDDPTSISSDRIRAVAEDTRGDLWVATRDGGLNRMPAGETSFERLRHDPDDPAGLPSDNVRFVLPDTGAVVWVATNRGFGRYEPGRGFTLFRVDSVKTGGAASDNVRHLMHGLDGMIWISTAGGLARFDPATGAIVVYRHDPDDPRSISSDNIRMACEDSAGRLWVCTTHGGLNLLDRTTGTFTSFRHDRNDPHTLSNDNTREAFEDAGGMLWVGTIGGGLSVYDPRTDRFRQYRHDPDDDGSLSDPILWSIAEGPDGDLWFGTSRGLDRYRRDTGTMRHFAFEPDEGEHVTARNYTRSMTWDRSGRLWVGRQYTGVDIYDPDRDAFAKPPRAVGQPDALAEGNVRAIHQDAAGDMWFGTWGGGLRNYGPETGVLTDFRHDPDDPASLSHDNVVSVRQDSDGAYWVATARGLNRLVFDGDPATPVSSGTRRPRITRFHHDPTDPRSISNDYVLSIHEARNGDLWFGTMLGLTRLRFSDRAAPVFERYFMKDGLPSDVVYGILEDGSGRLWLSTNYGVACLDPDTGRFRNYDTRDGLLVNEYNTGAYAGTAAGTFVFGGVGGASEFDPATFVEKEFAPSVVLTRFSVFDQPMPLEDGETITLSHQDNAFSFEFAALDFATPDRNRFSYMLEGLDRDWSTPGTRNFAGYTRVGPGSYTFRVRGTNSDGVWSDRVASMAIVVTPPFWKTWWFMLLVILAAGGGAALLITVRVRHMLAIERLRNRIAADLHDEIGAGLTEISMMGHVITMKLPSESRELVQDEALKIRSRSRELIACMRDIVWLVNPGLDSLDDLVARLGDAFSETLNSLGVRFRTGDLEPLQSVRLDMESRQHLFLIFKEALNNSLKYSGCSVIELEAERRGNRLVMRLRDDGTGFEMDGHAKGNGLNNMKARAAALGGEVRVRSDRGQGTTVEYTGPLG